MDHSERGTLQAAKFSIGKDDLKEIVDSYRGRSVCEEVQKIQELGGIEHLCTVLEVDIERGISSESVTERGLHYGVNSKKPMPRKTFLGLCLEAFMDKIMLILFSLGILSIFLGAFVGENPEIDWIDGVAIIIAVIIVVFVTGLNDYQKQSKFTKLQEIHKNRQNVTVIRNGHLEAMHPEHLVVGDLLELSDGCIIPIDGIIIQASRMEVDESAITGENEKLKKSSLADSVNVYNELLRRNPEIADGVKGSKFQHEVPSPICISGTTVAEGRCQVVVVAVGENTSEGRIMNLAEAKDEQTPLEIKLDKITDLVSILGLIFAGIAVLVLFIRMFIEMGAGDIDSDEGRLDDSVNFIIIGITVLVLAIPEGLPLAVTISLAYSVMKMQRDNNLVKRMQACETMGGANEICSDKTGTLTTNNMRVAKFWMDQNLIDVGYNNPFGPHPEYFARLKEGVCALTNARIEGTEEHGSKTEVAIIKMLVEFGHDDYLDLRTKLIRRGAEVFPFSSVRKRASVVLTSDNKERKAYVMGASEMVLESCTHFLSVDGKFQPLDGKVREQMTQAIEGMASDGLRTVLIATRELPEDYDINAKTPDGFPLLEFEQLTCIGMIGISDPVRPGVQQAVSNCKRAHIRVRMVTGDNIVTATAVARECGILRSENNVMDGRTFSERVGGIVCTKCRTQECECTREERTDTVGDLDEFRKIVDDLDVLARSQPEHKYLLVTGLKEIGSVVAVTGDGTNDAPALKKADIGFAMGVAGTEHARECADIILLDDNFASIVNSVKWGRNIFDNIKKFLQFQLTVNVVAVTTAIVGAVTIKQSPLTAVQILWVNLIMDTFAALALATEPPTEKHLDRYPHSRRETIVTPDMWKNIFGQALMQCIVIFAILYAGEWFLPETGDTSDPEVLTNPDNDNYVISGRDYFFDGSKDYKDLYDDEDIGPSRHMTILFNTFIFFQQMNEFNCRLLGKEINLFKGLWTNYMFICIWLFTVVIQVLMITFGGYVLSCHFQGLTVEQWFICLGFSLLAFPTKFLLVLLPSTCFNKLAKVGNQQLARHISSSLRRPGGSINRIHIS